MKDWGLAGEKPSFIVVLSTFPHQHENHLRWPSFPASFDFICSSILVIWPNQSHIKEVAAIWKHLYGNSKMVPRYFEQLADWASENVLRFFDTDTENVSVDFPLCLWQMIFTRHLSINTVSSSSSFSDHGPGLHQRSLCRFRAFAKSSSNLLVHLLLQFEIVSKKRAAVVVVEHV